MTLQGIRCYNFFPHQVGLDRGCQIERRIQGEITMHTQFFDLLRDMLCARLDITVLDMCIFVLINIFLRKSTVYYSMSALKKRI